MPAGQTALRGSRKTTRSSRHGRNRIHRGQCFAPSGVSPIFDCATDLPKSLGERDLVRQLHPGFGGEQVVESLARLGLILLCAKD